MMEAQEIPSQKEISERENSENHYVNRMINLTFLAPDIVAAILEDELPGHITLFELAVDSPLLWKAQK